MCLLIGTDPPVCVRDFEMSARLMIVPMAWSCPYDMSVRTPRSASASSRGGALLVHDGASLKPFQLDADPTGNDAPYWLAAAWINSERRIAYSLKYFEAA